MTVSDPMTPTATHWTPLGAVGSNRTKSWYRIRVSWMSEPKASLRHSGGFVAWWSLCGKSFFNKTLFLQSDRWFVKLGKRWFAKKCQLLTSRSHCSLLLIGIGHILDLKGWRGAGIPQIQRIRRTFNPGISSSMSQSSNISPHDLGKLITEHVVKGILLLAARVPRMRWVLECLLMHHIQAWRV